MTSREEQTIGRPAFFALGDRFQLTRRMPWSGRGRRGVERVTEIIRITHFPVTGQFGYIVEAVLDVTDPIPTNPQGHARRGGMDVDYATELVAAGELVPVGASPQTWQTAGPSGTTLGLIAGLLAVDARLVVTVEYPGCLVIPHRDGDGKAWWFGTANGTWAGDLMTADGSNVLTTLDTAVAPDAEAGTVALAIARILLDGAAR